MITNYTFLKLIITQKSIKILEMKSMGLRVYHHYSSSKLPTIADFFYHILITVLSNWLDSTNFVPFQPMFIII